MKAAPIVCRFATPADKTAIAEFNERLVAGGSPVTISTTEECYWGPSTDGLPRRVLMLAAEEHAIRAAVILYHNTMYVDGAARRLCWIQMPISEGIVNRAYSMAIAKLMAAAAQYEPLLISLGVGSLEASWSRFAKSTGWKHGFVPFFFYPVNWTRVLKGLKYLEKRPAAGVGAKIAARLGVGSVAGLAGKTHRALRHRFSIEAEVVSSFNSWADDVFWNALPDYPVVAARDAATLNVVYPPDDRRFERIRVKSAETGMDVGWIVVCAAKMENNPYFGDLKVGVLVDGMGRSANVPALVAAGVRHLVGAKVDLIVANWSHTAWSQAAARLGFFHGPSNYLALVAKQGSAAVRSFENLGDLHITRGDSDGMVSFRRATSLASDRLPAEVGSA